MQCNGKWTAIGVGILDHSKDPGFSFLFYIIMIICGKMISPVDCEFQNLLLPCSWSHLTTPISNRLPKTGPRFSFTIAVTMGTVTRGFLFLLCALFWWNTALFTQVLNSSLPCTPIWWNLSTKISEYNPSYAFLPCWLNSGPHLPSELL